MGTGPTVGQTMAGLTIWLVILWAAAVTKVTQGQHLLSSRQPDNLKASEIRFDSRAIRWMDFSKPERQVQAPQQVHKDITVLPSPTNRRHNGVNQLNLATLSSHLDKILEKHLSLLVEKQKQMTFSIH